MGLQLAVDLGHASLQDYAAEFLQGLAESEGSVLFWEALYSVGKREVQ